MTAFILQWRSRVVGTDTLGWPEGSLGFFRKMALEALSCLQLNLKQFC